MNYRLAAILLLPALISSTGHARFSEFVHVAPGIEKLPPGKSYAISTNPVLTMVASGTNTFTVTIPLKETGRHQQYWAIRCKSSLGERSRMNFRHHVWGLDKRNDIERSAALQVEPGRKSLSLQIPADAMDRTYVYQDYARPVTDGGYYYCFDIPAYYTKYRAERPAATMTIEALAEAYLAGLQAGNPDALWPLVHPRIVAALDDDGRRVVESSWRRRMELSIDAGAKRHFKELDAGVDSSFGGAFYVYVPVTHTFQFDGTRKDGIGSYALVYVNHDHNRWSIVPLVPKPQPAQKPEQR